MKIGILTFHAADNYGAVLQAYGLKEVLRGIMQFCMAKNLKPIVVMPPVHSSLTKYFTHSFRNNYIDSFIKETLHDSIPYLDYMDDRLFADKIYYSNSFFLNKRGRKLFTCRVLQDVGLM